MVHGDHHRAMPVRSSDHQHRATWNTVTYTRSLTTQPLSEKRFLQQVIDYARATGWLASHSFDSRHSESGLPDLTMVRAPRLVYAELKVDKIRARVPMASIAARPEWLACRDVTDMQAHWLAQFDKVGMALAASVDPERYEAAGRPTLEVYLWRPSDWELIERVLR